MIRSHVGSSWTAVVCTSDIRFKHFAIMWQVEFLQQLMNVVQVQLSELKSQVEIMQECIAEAISDSRIDIDSLQTAAVP